MIPIELFTGGVIGLEADGVYLQVDAVIGDGLGNVAGCWSEVGVALVSSVAHENHRAAGFAQIVARLFEG